MNQTKTNLYRGVYCYVLINVIYTNKNLFCCRKTWSGLVRVWTFFSGLFKNCWGKLCLRRVVGQKPQTVQRKVTSQRVQRNLEKLFRVAISSRIYLYGCLIHPLRSFAGDSLSKSISLNLQSILSQCFKEDSKLEPSSGFPFRGLLYREGAIAREQSTYCSKVIPHYRKTRLFHGDA